MSNTTQVHRFTKSPPSLEEAQKLVGGYVELIYTPAGEQMLVNEEGLLHGLPENELASDLAGKLIVGDVVVLTADAVWE